MKKVYTLFISAIVMISCEKSFSQFTYIKVDTAKYGTPGDELIFSATLINNTANAISMRVTREQNVVTEASTWTSAFCMDVCYLPGTDSVNYSFASMDTVDFTFHMYTTSTPGHATAIMKWRNTASTSNTFTQSFFGSTDGSQAGVNNLNGNTASVNIYPMPVTSGDVFSMNIATAKPENKISIVIYNIFGSVVHRSNVISGINLMNIDLPAGIYSYSLISNNSPVYSGKLAISK
jgi:hypothetical protein